jgi:uncharacterized protein YcbK (DUF882 family)
MPDLSRRRFLVSASAVAPALLLPARAWADTAAPRSLKFSHTHTGEHLAIEYFRNGSYEPEALATLDHFLRDFRTNDIHPIDAGLFDLLHTLADRTGTRQPFQVISGYRSPATNAMLRQHSEGVAAHSLHMQGQAIDIRLADVPLAGLRDAALSVRRGGVGFYPGSDFVHVDTGRVRRW